MATQWLSVVAVAFTLPLVVLVSNVLHEVGHMVAALVVGYRVRGFILGGESPDYVRSGPFFQTGRKFGRATAMISPRHGWIEGWRGIVTYSGGAAVNLVVVVFTVERAFSFVLAHGVRLHSGVHTVEALINIFFFAVNGRAVVWNLVPRVYPSGTVSDGKHLANLIHARRLVEWVKVAESSVDIDRQLEDVWEFLDDPANIPRYDTDMERAYVKPGTGPGLGRVVVTHGRPSAQGEQGKVTEMEVISYDPPRRVMSRGVRHHSLRAELLLRPVGDGTTRLTRTVWLGMKPLAPEQREQMRRDLAQIGPQIARANDLIRRTLAPDTTEVLSIGRRGRRHGRTRSRMRDHAH